ncbi:MAG: cytochrome C' [Betaproteobacteria bacterium]|nr:MAG: cytochrome C' [Betaproteobacteria bacterium]
MKLAVLALSLATVISIPAHASEDLAKANGCTACHQLDKKVIGPAYGQVSACYATKDAKKLAENKAKLVKHVIDGGAGVFGQIPMPAHPQLKDGAKNAELVKIIDWIMKDVKATECPKEFKPK